MTGLTVDFYNKKRLSADAVRETLLALGPECHCSFLTAAVGQSGRRVSFPESHAVDAGDLILSDQFAPRETLVPGVNLTRTSSRVRLVDLDDLGELLDNCRGVGLLCSAPVTARVGEACKPIDALRVVIDGANRPLYASVLWVALGSSGPDAESHLVRILYSRDVVVARSPGGLICGADGARENLLLLRRLVDRFAARFPQGYRPGIQLESVPFSREDEARYREVSGLK